MAAADAIADRIPFGKPVLVGHHSERRHQADIRRMHAHKDRFVKALSESKQSERAAKAADHHMARREAPLVVAHRIDRLETDLRRTTAVLEGPSAAYGGRSPDGEWKAQLEARIAYLASQLDYWRKMRGDQAEAGRAHEYKRGRRRARRPGTGPRPAADSGAGEPDDDRRPDAVLVHRPAVP